jgi:hypothetical protein
MALYYDDAIRAGTAWQPDWLGQNVSGSRAYADDAMFIVGVDTGQVAGTIPLFNGTFGNPFSRGFRQ